MKNQLIGFRSGNKVKKTIASIFLLFALLLSAILVIFSSQSYTQLVQDDIAAKLFGLCMVSLFWIPYLIMSNIFGVRDFLPLYKKRKLLTTLVAIVVTNLIIFMLAGATSELNSDEYLELQAVAREEQHFEQGQAEGEKLEAEELKQEQVEADRLEQEKLEQEQAEAERLEQEKLEQEQANDIFNNFEKIKVDSNVTVFARDFFTEGLIYKDDNYIIIITKTPEKTSGDQYHSTYKFTGTLENISGDYVSALGLNFCGLDENNKVLSGYDAGFAIVSNNETNKLIEDGDIVEFEASILLSTTYQEKYAKIGLTSVSKFGY